MDVAAQARTERLLERGRRAPKNDRTSGRSLLHHLEAKAGGVRPDPGQVLDASAMPSAELLAAEVGPVRGKPRSQLVHPRKHMRLGAPPQPDGDLEPSAPRCGPQVPGSAQGLALASAQVGASLGRARHTPWKGRGSR